MGRIVRLPVPPVPYPDRSAELDKAECILLIALRWWVSDYRESTDPLPRLCQAMDRADAHDAAFSVDQLMSIIARSVRRPIAVHCPRCPQLGADEACLLHAASLAQASDGRLAEQALRTTLLSAQGAELALGPLEGLGALFAEARLFLRKRLAPRTNCAAPGDAVSALSPAPSKTVH